MKSWLFKLLSDLRTSLWFIPTLMVIAAALLSFVMSHADEYFLIHQDKLRWLALFAYAGEPAGARTVLGAIAGSMITVAGTVFSITIVALSLASSQFGPRLLRNFLSDRGNQAVLGTFVATFLYCILVMRHVYGESDEKNAQVPVMSISLAVAFGILSLGVLIYFIHHIAQSMQAGHIVSSVYDELTVQVTELFPSKEDRSIKPQHLIKPQYLIKPQHLIKPQYPIEPQHPISELDALEAALDSEAHATIAKDSGYIQGVDAEGLLSLAEKHDLVLRVALLPGDFVLPGAALVHFIPSKSDEEAEQIATQVRECFALDVYRTPYQNIEFGIDQIVEVAVRALSPGINDPFTAMVCIDRLGATLCLIAQKEFPSPYRCGSQGKVRLIMPPVSYRSLVDRAFNQIRQNARAVPAVIIRLTETLARIGEMETSTRKRVLLRQLTAISEQVEAIPAACDQEDLRDTIALARRCLASAASSAIRRQPAPEAIHRHHRRLQNLDES